MNCDPPVKVLKALRNQKLFQKEAERKVVDDILESELEDYGVKDIHDLNEIDRREGRIKDDPDFPYTPFRGKVISLGGKNG